MSIHPADLDLLKLVFDQTGDFGVDECVRSFALLYRGQHTYTTATLKAKFADMERRASQPVFAADQSVDDSDVVDLTNPAEVHTEQRPAHGLTRREEHKANATCAYDSVNQSASPAGSTPTGYESDEDEQLMLKLGRAQSRQQIEIDQSNLTQKQYKRDEQLRQQAERQAAWKARGRWLGTAVNYGMVLGAWWFVLYRGWTSRGLLWDTATAAVGQMRQYINGTAAAALAHVPGTQ